MLKIKPDGNALVLVNSFGNELHAFARVTIPLSIRSINKHKASSNHISFLFIKVVEKENGRQLSLFKSLAFAHAKKHRTV